MVSVDPERVLNYRRLLLTFPLTANYGFVAEVEKEDGTWEEIANEVVGVDEERVREIPRGMFRVGASASKSRHRAE